MPNQFSSACVVRQNDNLVTCLLVILSHLHLWVKLHSNYCVKARLFLSAFVHHFLLSFSFCFAEGLIEIVGTLCV